MTEPFDTTPPAGEPLADEPIPEAEPAAAGDEAESGASTQARAWIAQLETMIHEVATQAAPVARQIGAKAAELAAVAAVKAGPMAQRVAEVTTEQGQRFAEKAHAVAAELRAQDAPVTDDGDAAPDATPDAAPDAAPDATPEAEPGPVAEAAGDEAASA